MKYLRLAPALVWMGMIFYLSSIPDLKLGEAYSNIDFILRKCAHMTEYGVLWGLWAWGLSSVTKVSVKKRLIIATLIAFIYAITDEIHQSIVPTRHGAVLDVLIDSIGIAAGWLLVKLRYGTKNAL